MPISAAAPSRAGVEPGAHELPLWKDPVTIALVVGAFLLRVLYNLALHPDGRPPLSFVIDEPEYFAAAHMLAEGRGFSFFDTAQWVRPPLYVLFLAPFARLQDGYYLPALVAQSLVSALTLLPLGLLARQAGGLSAARWAVLLGAIYLPFTLFAGLMLTETLFLLLFLLALVALIRAGHTTGSTSRHKLAMAAAAGGLLGLTVLTRATALAFVPVAAAWLVFSNRGLSRRSGLAAGAALVVVSLLVIAPWTARNFRAYGRFVPVDTTSGYNLWLGSIGVRDEDRLRAELETMPNPADRQAYAFARGLENIVRDPGGFAGKGLKETLDLWRPLFSAEERQIRGYAVGRVPAWHLSALLVLDDFVYLGILLASAIGLVVAGPGPFRAITLLWIALWVVTAFIFFAVTRFRLPIVAVLIPWAGIGIATLVGRSPRRVLGAFTLRSRSLLAGAGVLALLVTIPSLPIYDTALGVVRWSQQEPFREGERLLKQGDIDGAIASYRQASPGLFDTRYSLAAALLQKGDISGALAQLRDDEPQGRYEPAIIRGEAARRAGNVEGASAFFKAREVQVAGQEAVDWAWDHLRPPAVRDLALGTGLDLGYIKGFHGAESDTNGSTYRWSTGQASIRGIQGEQVIASLSGWRPDAAPPARLTPATAGRPGIVISPVNSADWEVVTLLQDHETGGRLKNRVVELKISLFVGAGSDPRLLGVRIASVGSR